MGKPKAPPPPDYSGIAAANEKAAKYSYKTAQKQLAWAKEQYALDRQVTDKVVDASLDRMKMQDEWATEDRARYKEKFQPLEDDLIHDAQTYSSKGRQELEAGKAAADVSQQFQLARAAAQDQLESFGIDPTQVRSQALDISTRMGEAAARAGAANQARQHTEDVGRALRSEALNIGKGYPGQYVTAAASATNTGNSAVNAGLATTATGAQAMGTPTQWMGLNNQALGNWGSLVNGIYSTQMEGYKASLNSSSGIGSALGMIAGIGANMMGFSDERVKEDITEVGKTNDGQPIYSYHYKGDNEPRMGLMAQDVEKRDPGAVVAGPGGIKMVNYDRALKDAEEPAPEYNDGKKISLEAVKWKGEEFFHKLEKKAREQRKAAIPENS